MPITSFIIAISGSYPDIAIISNKVVSSKEFINNNRHFFPCGEPISTHLLRYSAFAVEDHSIIRCALHLRQPRLVNNLSE